MTPGWEPDVVPGGWLADEHFRPFVLELERRHLIRRDLYRHAFVITPLWYVLGGWWFVAQFVNLWDAAFWIHRHRAYWFRRLKTWMEVWDFRFAQRYADRRCCFSLAFAAALRESGRGPGSLFNPVIGNPPYHA